MSRIFKAVVMDIREHSRRGGRSRWQILLDSAGFGVGDRGVLRARSRGGAVLEVPVLDVEQDGHDFWLAAEKPLLAETEVEAEVWSAAGD